MCFFITHDNDSQGEHGSHVAGIAAGQPEAGEAAVFADVADYDFGEAAGLEFADADTISPAYLEAVEAIVSAGIMGGVGDGTSFAPFMTANRGMSATVLVRLYNLVNE